MDPANLTRDDLLRHIESLNAELLELRERLRQADDQSDWLGGAMKARTRVLNERVKELECVYETVRLLRDPDLAFERKVGRIVDLLPRAWQHPGIACARAVLDGKEFRTTRFIDAPWALSEPVCVKGAPVGHVEVRYVRPSAPADDGPFLREERELLRVVAQCLGAAYEASAATRP